MNPPFPLEYATTLAQTSQTLMQELGSALMGQEGQAAGLDRYMKLAAAQQTYMQQMGMLWTSMSMRPLGGDGKEKPATKPDRRFAAPEWQESPFHDFLRQSYLLNGRYVYDLIESASVDDKTRGRLRFFARQILDALSPSNYLATNPQSVQRAIATGGESLAKGVKNLIEDLGKGRISMTDAQAFEVGGNLAVTPGAVVFENDLIQVIQYSPSTKKVGTRPLLLIPPAINKFYVLDLQPENSFARYAVEEGNTVFMLSWRNVKAEQGHLTWDDYLDLGIMRAIDVALAITGADRINALGFCVGGTLLGCAAAVMAARGEDKLASLTFLTTMLDFGDAGEIALLIDETSLAMREQTIGRGGVMPGRELDFVFSTLRGNDLIWPYVVGNYLEGRQPDAFDILYWNADSTNLPGPMYCWYVRNMYLENNLRVPGKTTQCGVPVDLSAIKVPVFVLASREDHIVPWRTSYRTTELVSGAARFVLAASGHIAGVINPASRNKRNYWTEGEIGQAPDRWLQTAREVPGSWWPDWSAWLRGHAGRQVKARTKLGNAEFREIEPAPGRFVKEAAT
jgi:polyhydroxyalkanoate synthase subunit PhaC